jgi:hypothetical protein
MPFELQTVTEVAFTNANTRPEFHGEEHVRAVDITMRIKGENTLLDLIEKGLREHHFCNHALQAGQEHLPDVVIPLPNLRYPKLPTKFNYAKGEKWRGYRFVQDFGLGDEAGSNLDFTDCVLTGLCYEIFEGGSVEIGFTVQYNGDELADDGVYGRCAGLATVGTGHVQVIAPPTLTLVKGKGAYRSGKPDTPPAADGDEGGDLLTDADGDGDVDVDADDEDQDTPEKALARAAAAG